MAPYDSLNRIARPLHVHGVKSPEEYESEQIGQIQRRSAARPSLGPMKLWDMTKPAPARITGSKWVVDCPCGNAPSASPEWNIARCFECGAIFRNIVWPADRAVIETVLLIRPNATMRGWRPNQSVEDLRQENLQHGLRGLL